MTKAIRDEKPCYAGCKAGDALVDRLTRLATVGRQLRPVRNALLHFLAHVPALRRSLAWRLSGLVPGSVSGSALSGRSDRG